MEKLRAVADPRARNKFMYLKIWPFLSAIWYLIPFMEQISFICLIWKLVFTMLGWIPEGIEISAFSTKLNLFKYIVFALKANTAGAPFPALMIVIFINNIQTLLVFILMISRSGARKTKFIICIWKIFYADWPNDIVILSEQIYITDR